VIPCVDDRLFDGTDGLGPDLLAGAGALLADVRWADGAQALMIEARRRGIPTVLDADIASPEVLKRLMPLADHLLLSQQALALIEDAAEPDIALSALARRMPAAKLLCVTLGPGGVALIDRASAPDRLIRVEAFVVDAVDTLNAGDVWHGSYAWALGCGLPVLERIRWANAAAAIKCTRPWGRVGVPDQEEVHRFLDARR
jgi:sulfofructose kinase